MDTARCPSARKHCGHHGNRRFRLPDKSRKPMCLRRRLRTHVHSLFRKQTATNVRRNGKNFTIPIHATPSSLTAGDHRKEVRQPPDSNLPSPAMQVTPDCSPRGAYMKSNQRLLARQSDTCSHTMTYPSDFKLLTRPPRPCRRTSATRPDLRYDLWLLPDG